MGLGASPACTAPAGRGRRRWSKEGEMEEEDEEEGGGVQAPSSPNDSLQRKMLVCF